MLSLSSSEKFVLYFPPTDMRKSFGSLSGVVRLELDSDPTDGLFMFL